MKTLSEKRKKRLPVSKKEMKKWNFDKSTKNHYCFLQISVLLRSSSIFFPIQFKYSFLLVVIRSGYCFWNFVLEETLGGVSKVITNFYISCYFSCKVDCGMRFGDGGLKLFNSSANITKTSEYFGKFCFTQQSSLNQIKISLCFSYPET